MTHAPKAPERRQGPDFLQLAEELGTPLYVYEKDAILAQLAASSAPFRA